MEEREEKDPSGRERVHEKNETREVVFHRRQRHPFLPLPSRFIRTNRCPIFQAVSLKYLSRTLKSAEAHYADRVTFRTL